MRSIREGTQWRWQCLESATYWVSCWAVSMYPVYDRPWDYKDKQQNYTLTWLENKENSGVAFKSPPITSWLFFKTILISIWKIYGYIARGENLRSFFFRRAKFGKIIYSLLSYFLKLPCKNHRIEEYYLILNKQHSVCFWPPPTSLPHSYFVTGGSYQGKGKYTNIFKKLLFLIRTCLVAGMATGGGKTAFSGTRQPGSKDNLSGDGILVFSHLVWKPCTGCRNIIQTSFCTEWTLKVQGREGWRVSTLLESKHLALPPPVSRLL